jgi:DASS family divalent anion:Na+ symporter
MTSQMTATVRQGGPTPRPVEIAGWICAVAVPPLVYVAARLGDVSVEASIFAGILSAAVLMWIFALVDEFIPPVAVVVATLFIGLAPPSVALAGFSSPGFITLLGVFALAATIGGSGLSSRVMLWLLVRLPDRPFFHRLVPLVGGLLLSPITPSGNNRMALLLPIYDGLLDGLRLPQRSAAATAIFAATYSGAMLFSPMLATSKSSNIAATALLPLQVQEDFLGLFWPIAAAAAAVGLVAWHVATTTWLVPADGVATLPRRELRGKLATLGPLKPMEWISAGGFLFFLVGTASVSWHHVKPAWIAGCVLVGLLLSGALGKEAFRRQIDWPMIVFLLGVDGIVRIMDHLGIGPTLAAATGHLYGFIDGRIEWFILAVLATTLVARLALPVTAGMLVAVVILLPVAAAEEIHPWICVFLAAMFSDIFFLRYQSSVYVQVQSQGEAATFDERRFMTYNMSMNLARLAVAFLSIPWWRWLGLV